MNLIQRITASRANRGSSVENHYSIGLYCILIDTALRKSLGTLAVFQRSVYREFTAESSAHDL